ncbi:hypothetical protein [Shewanella khirikhana]|nr:hypothetical protein [Shewanella khirikhana]
MSDNLLLIGFLVDEFFGLSPRDKESEEIFKAIISDVEAMATLVNGKVFHQVYFKKFRELCSLIGEGVIVNCIKRGDAVSDVAFRFGVSSIHVYRICKRNKLKVPKVGKEKEGICEIINEIESNILSIMLADGFSLNQAKREMDILNKSICRI